MLAIWKRELQSYFFTPIGYVFMGFFLLVSGLLFFMSNILNGSGDLATVFGNLSSLFMFVMPVLTMRLMSEERRTKTDQLLLTSPASITGIVVGKFFAACTVFVLTLACSLVYVLIISVYGHPYIGKIFTGYAGAMLMGFSYIAIGVLMSTLSENQVSAAVSTFGVNLLLQLLESVGPNLNIPNFPFINTALSWLSLQTRAYDFTIGILSIANILYFVSFCAIILYLAVRVIEKRRWSEG